LKAVSSGKDVSSVTTAWQRALRIATDNEEADTLIRGGRVVNVFTQELENANVAIADGKIVGVGDYDHAKEIIDLDGAYLAPSFIDGHIHIESSLLWITEFARAVIPHGTGAVITDPHEIANVAGLPGFKAFVNAGRTAPMGIHFTVPSCVPASPFETAGAEMTAADIAAAFQEENVIALGEMMNFPGVLAGDTDIRAKLDAAGGRRIDGHAPGVRGRALDGYVLSGMTSDHESSELEEGRQKLARGMMLMLREGSSARNMLDLLPLVTDQTYARCCFASDDQDCSMLLHGGHMNATLRKAVAAGLDPVRAIRMATFNVADYWRLDRVGAIAPGYWANLVVLEDLESFAARQVVFQGTLVAEGGHALFDATTEVPDVLLNTVNMRPFDVGSLRLTPENARRAVGAIDGQIVTRLIEVEPRIENGEAVVDLARDLLKLVCVERHNATGNIGVGYIQGFGLWSGALASSIAHDAHNIVAVGVTDSDIKLAVDTVAASQGGLAVVSDGQIVAHMALPIAGILSDRPLEETAAQYHRMEEAARELGSSLGSPFGLLAFMALSVIPEARITDLGFVAL
jgi:adenine deaminase